MNQGNHWPLGSRFMSSEEVSTQLAQSALGVGFQPMTLSEVSASLAAEKKKSGDLTSAKQVSSSREIRPVNWLGRP
jgi:hypothetical protein